MCLISVCDKSTKLVFCQMRAHIVVCTVQAELFWNLKLELLGLKSP